MRDIKELTKEEVEELTKDYQRPSSEITVAQIIEKYNLDIKPNKIADSLPEQITEKVCPYCNEKMFAKIKNRSEMHAPFCKQCGHVLYKESRWSWQREECDCYNCKNVKEEEEKRKREIIKIYYTREHKLFELEELTLKEKVNLMKIIKECSNNSSCVYIGKKYGNYAQEVKELFEKGIISVSPLSPIEAFSEDNFPSQFYPARVFFAVNVNQLNANNIESLFETEYEKAPAEDKYELFMEVMHRDILERFEIMMRERGLDFEVLSNAEDSLKTLYEKVSYAQIMTLCFNVARYYLDNTKTGKIYKKAAAKGAVKSVVTFYNNQVSKGWQISNSEVEYAGHKLKYYVTYIMKKDIRILREVITIKDFE